MTDCWESETAETPEVITPLLEGLKWGRILDEVLGVIKKSEPEVGYVTGEGMYPILSLSAEQRKAIDTVGVGGIPFSSYTINPVILNFTAEEAGIPMLITASVWLDFSNNGRVTTAGDAQKAMDAVWNELYGEPVQGNSRGTSALVLKKAGCNSLTADKLSILQNHDDNVFYIYPVLSASLTSANVTTVNCGAMRIII